MGFESLLGNARLKENLTGAVRRGIVVTVNVQLLQLAHRYLRDIREQVVGDAAGILTDQAAFVGSNGIKVP